MNYLYKTVKKNEQLFFKKFLQNKDFYHDLDTLTFKLTGKYLPANESSYESEHMFKSMRNEVDELWQKSLPNFDSEIISSILIFLSKYGLGKEWIETIVYLIFANYYLFPKYNFYLFVTENTEHKVRLSLELNPDTSIADIKAGWSEIKRLKKQFYPSFRRIKYTKKFYNNIKIFLDDIALKNNPEVKDLDKVGRIWPDEEPLKSSKQKDLRRRELLRQIRHRLKRDKI